MTSFCPITDNAALRTVVLPDMGCPYRTPMAHPPRMDWIVSKFAPIPTQPSVRTACPKLLLVRSLRAHTKFFNAVPSSTSAIIHSCRTIQISKERWLAMKGLRRNLSKVVYTGEEGFLADETFWMCPNREVLFFFLVPVRCNNCLCLSGRSLLSIERRSVSSRCRHGSPALWNCWTLRKKKIIFLFLHSDAVLSESTLENKISERFRFVVIQKFCYHGNVT